MIDTFNGLSLPSTNISLVVLLLDYFHYLGSQTYVIIHKVQSHVGIPGNERADQNAAKGVTSSSINSHHFSFPPAKLFPLPTDQDSSFPETVRFIQKISSAADSHFPALRSSARKPYITAHTLSLIQQLPTTSDSELRSFLKKKRKIKIVDHHQSSH